MEQIVGVLGEQQAELAGLVDGLSEEQWAAPSACAGWAVSDVLLHLAQTNEMAIGSARGDLLGAMATLSEGLAPASGDIDDGAALMVDHQRGATGDAVRARWATSCVELRGALLDLEPGDRLTWVAGELAARTLGTTRLAETWIHTGDIAAGLGVDLAPTDRLWHIARLAWRTIPYAFTRDGLEPPGPVAFELVGPSGAAWSFRPERDEDVVATITGPGAELCQVASRRVPRAATSLATDTDVGEQVLDRVRTWA